MDYAFLTVEQFAELERSGNLLESGVYEGMAPTERDWMGERASLNGTRIARLRVHFSRGGGVYNGLNYAQSRWAFICMPFMISFAAMLLYAFDGNAL